jgi:hypothetical protein
VYRIGVEERRARLVRRHRLHPGDRAGDALEATRSVVVLHSTDPVTVFLSVHARTSGVTPEDIERELYVERTLIRMLGMRRTLFVVPRDFVPVVHAACTRTIAARERRRLEQMIVDSGISTRPAAWLSRASTAALRALEARGDAFTTDFTKAVPALANRTPSSTSTGSRPRPRRRPRAHSDAGAVHSSLAHPRSDDDGLEGAGVVPRLLRPVLFDTNGNAGPTVWWEGRVVGGWSQRRGGEIVFRLLEDVGSDAVRAVETEATRVAAWLGDVRFSPGFLPQFQRELAAS